MHLSRNCFIRGLALSDFEKICSSTSDSNTTISIPHPVNISVASPSLKKSPSLSSNTKMKENMLTPSISLKKFFDDKEIEAPAVSSTMSIAKNNIINNPLDLSYFQFIDIEEECRESDDVQLEATDYDSDSEKTTIDKSSTNSLIRSQQSDIKLQMSQDSEVVEEEITPSPPAPKKKVSFSTAHFILIPSKEEYIKANLSEKIWWSQAEIDLNLKNHLKKIQKVIKYHIRKLGYETKGLKNTSKGRQIFQDIRNYVKQQIIADPTYLEYILELEKNSDQAESAQQLPNPSKNNNNLKLSNSIIPSFLSTSFALSPDKFAL